MLKSCCYFFIFLHHDWYKVNKSKPAHLLIFSLYSFNFLELLELRAEKLWYCIFWRISLFKISCKKIASNTFWHLTSDLTQQSLLLTYQIESMMFRKTLQNSLLESCLKKVACLQVWNFLKETPAQVFSCLLCTIFKEHYLQQNNSGWQLLLIPPFQLRFYPLITFCSFFLHFFSFTINSCNYGSFFRKCIKNEHFLLFTIVYPKINMNIVKSISPQQ